MSNSLIFPGEIEGAPTRERATNRPYWACQIGGWGLMYVGNQLGSISLLPFTWVNFFLNIAVSVAGLGFTHLLRGLSRKRRWTELPALPLIKRVAIAILTLTLVSSVLSFVLGESTAWLSGKGAESEKFQFNSKAGMIAIMGVNFLVQYGIWCGIYFGVHALRRQQRAETERWKLEAALSAAELAALKAQLNPHFLFNALNGLRALVLEDPTRAQHLITGLAGILRYSLQVNARETVPLADELRMVNDYLDLEMLRFEERLQVIRDISPEALTVAVPPMAVQTLVENAIKYGVSRLPQPGEVRIAAQVEDGYLEVSVSNTGPLVPRGNGTGVGLRNAAERLHRLWGDAASLRLQEHPPGQVQATLRIPR